MQVAEKKVPWWRKALEFALGGIRSGFGLFPRSVKPALQEKDSFLHRSEENPEEEAGLTEPSVHLEAAAAIPATEAEQTPAPAPEPAPEFAPVVEPAAPIALALSEDLIAADAPQRSAVAAEVPEIAPESAAISKPQIALEVESAEVAEAVRSLPIASPSEPTLEAEVEVELEPEPEREAVLRSAPEPEEEMEAGSEAEPEVKLEFAFEAELKVQPQPEPEAKAESEPEPEAGLESELEPESEATPAHGPESEPELEPVSEPVAAAKPAAPEEPLAAADPASNVAPVPASVDDRIEPIVEQAVEPAEPIEPEAPADLPAFAPAHTVESAPQREPEESPVPEAATQAEPVPLAAPAAATSPVQPASMVPELPALPAVEAAPVQEAAPVPAPLPEQGSAGKPTEKTPIKLQSRDNEADLSPFSIIVEQVYDGPLDLLLDLIRKQDIDIYDIPIAKITAQFLAYVNQLKATDVDVAGEFIYIASLLIHIKSKMLLPRAATGPEDAAEDPRRELVERLLEHERFKNAAQMLQQKQMLEAATWTNPGLREFQGDESAEPEIAADTVDLVRIFRDILERARKRPVFNLDEDAVTVGQMIQFLSRRLTMEDKPVALRRLLSHTRSERALVAMFLALLELVRLQAVLLRQDRAFSEIFIKKHTGFDAVMNQGLANASDEWR
jgi:segregation and condensation protein A